MDHPEILLLPVLMIADYYLTILGAVLHKKQYGQHFVIETYEMNPDYRNEIDSESLFNFRFVFNVLFNFAILFLVAYLFTEKLEFIYQIVLGFYLTLFGYIIGLHVSNLLTFRFSKNNPETFEGSVRIPHKFNLRRSLYMNSVLFFPLLFVTVFSFSYYLLGAFASVIYNLCLGLYWISHSEN
ncbi:MAG: hypothetical protein R2681_11285 [Pyrinomonadaceae bacterium]